MPEKERRHRKKNSVLRFWSFSYILVFLLSFIICFATFVRCYEIINQETAANNEKLLAQLQSLVDTSISDARKIVSTLQFNQRVLSSSYVVGERTGNQTFALITLQSELHNLSVANAAIHNIHLYFPGMGVIVNTSTIVGFDLLPYTNLSIPTQAWQTMAEVQPDDSGKLMTQPQVQGISYLQAVNRSARSLCVVAVEFDVNNLRQQIQQTKAHHEAVFCVLDENQTIVLCSDASMEGTRLLVATEGSQRTDAQGYVRLDIPSSQVNLLYTYLVPSQQYHKQANDLIWLLSITLIIALGAAGIIIFVLTRRNYRPILELMAHIRPGKSLPDVNEYVLIKQSILESQTQILKQQNESLRAHTLLRILSGQTEYASISASTLKMLGLEFPYSHFIVMLVRMEVDSAGDDLASLQHQMRLYTELSDALLAKTRREEVVIEAFSAQNELVLLVNVEQAYAAHALEALILDVSAVIHDMNSRGMCEIHCGYSDLVASDSLTSGYYQARHVQEYMQIFDQHEMCSYAEATIADNDLDSAVEESGYLINLVITGQTQELQEALALIRQRYLGQSASIFDARYAMYFFYRVMLTLKTILGKRYEKDYPKALDRAYALFTTVSLAKNITLAEEILLEVCTFVRDSQPQKRSLSRAITDYIENNYIDPALNVNTLAEHFQMTPAYLSRKYKDETGEGILDRLYRVRIQSAKSLMRTTGLKIQNIAVSVGFIDSNAFIRIFKKYEGITPGVYKDSVSAYMETEAQE